MKTIDQIDNDALKIERKIKHIGAWMLIIIAVIIQYGEIMYSTFKMFGVLGDDLFIIKDVLDIGTLLSILPLIFISAAFIVMMVRFKRG